IVARDLASPGPNLLAPLPSAGVQQHDVAGSRLHTSLLFPRFQIGPGDGDAWFDPVHVLQLRDVVQDGARENPVLPVHDAALFASGFGRDVVLHRYAVVHLAVLEEVTPAVDVRHRQAVVADRVGIGGDAVRDGVGRSVKDAVGADIGRDLLRLVRSERDGGAAFYEVDGV